MKNLKEIKNILDQYKEEIKDRFFVEELAVFGSYAKNKQNPKSDLDILVTFKKPIDLFKFIELENYLSKLLKIKVELVTKRALKPNIGKQIFKEMIKV